jgi:hypothetical protein
VTVEPWTLAWPGVEEALAVDRAMFVSGGGFATAIGHASPEGPDNQTLSEKRADSIASAVTRAFGKSLALEDIEVIGHGSELAEFEGMLKPPAPPALQTHNQCGAPATVSVHAAKSESLPPVQKSGVRCGAGVAAAGVSLVGAQTDPVKQLVDPSALCALLEGGSIWCWGDNTEGLVRFPKVITHELDNIVYYFEPTPRKNESFGDDNVRIFGDVGNLCSVKRDGSLWCAGHNRYSPIPSKPVDGKFPEYVPATRMNLRCD